MREQERQFDPNVLAVVQRAGRRWRGLVVRLEPSPGEGGGPHRPRLIDSREFAPEMGEEIEGWIDGHLAGQVVCVLHGASVICRTCSLPDASPEQQRAALRLQAEAHLLGIAPPHRVGMAVMEQAAEEAGGRLGLILAWPESTPVGPPPLSRSIEYAPDLAALAAIMGNQRPSHPLLWIDRHDGSLAMALSHPNGVAFRGLREEAEESEAWKTAVGRTVAETGLNFGYSGSFIEGAVRNVQEWMDQVQPGDAQLHLPPQLIEHAAAKVDGAPTDAEWWSKFGALAGIVIARAGTLSPLTSLQKEAPTETPSIMGEVVDRLSRPSTARLAVLACVLVLMFGPLVMNTIRWGVLELRHGNLDEHLARYNEVSNKIAIYRELRDSSWSMTKALGDIANNTPQGIELEWVRINQNRQFNVRGTAIPFEDRPARDRVDFMRDSLRESGIFDEITMNWGDGDAYGANQFELSGYIAEPYFRKRYPTDREFAEWTLAERIYGLEPGEAKRLAEQSSAERMIDERTGARPTVSGEGAAPDETDRSDDPERDADEPERLADANDREDRPATRPNSERNRPTRSGAGDAGIPGESTGDARSAADDIPAPLSEREIAEMSDSELRQTLQKVSRGRRIAQAQGDDEAYERLKNEFEMILTRMRGDS